MHLIEQNQYRIAVKQEGAELCSFLDKAQMLEFIWQADPKVWPRHAPVLFPIVGKLQDDTYSYKGQEYQLPQHGFARDQKFDLLEKTDNSLTFELRENSTTLKHYPFRFVLQIQYLLDNNSVTIRHRVSNPADEDMYFSLGAHPGFNCPLQAGEFFTDYFLEFEKPETLERYLIEKGLLNGQTEKVLNKKSVLPLRDSLFAKDAIVLKSFASNRLTLRSNHNPNEVTVSFEGFPYLGIWSKPVGASFLCIEPWHGIASTIGSSTDLTHKEGIKRLAPGKDFSCSYTITVS
jgi:galactose mutarotase-like enzyme